MAETVRGEILDTLGSETGHRILDVRRDGPDFILSEACDYYFARRMSADDLERLGRELITAAAQARIYGG